MKIITFLGTGSYKETIYLHPHSGEKAKPTFLFQEALMDFYDPEEMLVLLTPTAAEGENWTAMKARLGQRVKLTPIFNVPEGQSPSQMWEIFDLINAHVRPGDRLVFDITHSFRAIPLVALLAVSYLRQVKKVEVLGLVYGAFDMKKQEQTSPSYDLLPMLSLLDWMSAVERFTETGDGRPLSHLLESVLSKEQQASDLNLKKAQNRLDNVAEKIRQVSQALALARPDETLKSSSSLKMSLNNAQDAIATYAKPFDLVREQVLVGYGQFSQQDRGDLRESLELQFQMIEWFMERSQVLQAIPLAREWLVSWVAFLLGENNLLSKVCRSATEGALHNGYKNLRGQPIDRPSPMDENFAALVNQAEISLLWDKLGQLRNDLAHVGMNESPGSVKSLEKKAKERFLDLKKLLS